jgi:hypothetical protein
MEEIRKGEERRERKGKEGKHKRRSYVSSTVHLTLPASLYVHC